MNDLRTAAQQALEALEDLADCGAEAWSEQRPCVQIGREAITALRAALAQQDEPVEPVAWVASKDGRVIYDDASTDDGLLRVSGDFENDEQRSRYAQRIVDKLNAALAQQAEPDHETRAELAEQQVVQLAEERDHYRSLWQKAQQAEPVQDQRCRAEPRSDGDFVCDCKIGECLGRSAALARQVKTCAWRDNLDAIYETECGNIHIVDDGTLEENGMKYCCYCGKEIKDESPT